MFRCSLFALGLLSLALCQSARAQYVRVGPLGGVSIRGARGSVDVLPFGLGTRVRGPQSSVDTGVYGLLAWPSSLHSSSFAPVDYSGMYGRYASGYNRSHAYPFIDTPILAPVVVPVYVAPVVHVPVAPAPIYAPPVFAQPYAEATFYPEPVYPESSYESAIIEPVPTSADYWMDESNIAMTSFEQVVDSPYPESVEDRLRVAAERLRNSLALRRDDADVWLSYLGPDAIIASLGTGNEAKTFKELLPNYLGVAGNSELTHIWSVDGFWQTHQALREWQDPSEVTEAVEGSATDTSDAGDSVLEPKSGTAPVDSDKTEPSQPWTERDRANDPAKTPAAPEKPNATSAAEPESLPAPMPESAAPETQSPEVEAPGAGAPVESSPFAMPPGR